MAIYAGILGIPEYPEPIILEVFNFVPIPTVIKINLQDYRSH